MNTTTKPLFEETLNIVFECFEKYKKGKDLLPIECLQNYQLIYNEDDDADRQHKDDNQIFTERLSIRYANKESLSRTSFRRFFPRVNTSRTSIHQNVPSDTNTNINTNTNTSNVVLPSITMTNSESPTNDVIRPNTVINNTTSYTPPPPPPPLPSIISPIPQIDSKPIINQTIRSTPPINVSTIDSIPSRILKTPLSLSTATTLTPLGLSITLTTPLSSILVNTNDDSNGTIEPLKHNDDIELERLIKPKSAEKLSKTKSLVSLPTSPSLSQQQRQLSLLTDRSNTKISKLSVKRTLSNANSINNLQRKKRIDLAPLIIDNRRYIHRHPIVPACTQTTKRKDKINHKNDKQINSPELVFFE